ncbi:MAG: TlpA family protein disulfide reductase [Solirubrobacteraceae bacterium]
MSASSVVIVIEAGLLAVVALFVVALLRSHAEILRRLAALEGATTTPAPVPAGPDRAPVDLVGQTPAGDSVKLALGPGSPRTLLAFLSSGCAACEPLWAGLHDRSPGPPGTRLVVVTKGADRESASRLAALAPPAQEVVMSTPAWEQFAVPVTPHFVLLGGDGRIAGRGSAGSWEQILALVQDAAADTADTADAADAADTADGKPASGSSARAARAEAALAAAGVTEGHPSLYPSRTTDGPAA